MNRKDNGLTTAELHHRYFPWELVLDGRFQSYLNREKVFSKLTIFSQLISFWYLFYNINTYCLAWRFRSSRSKSFQEKDVLKYIVKFTGKPCFGISFALNCRLEASNFLRFLRNSKQELFYKHLRTAAYGKRYLLQTSLFEYLRFLLLAEQTTVLQWRNCALYPLKFLMPEHLHKVIFWKYPWKQKLVQSPQKKTLELLQLSMVPTMGMSSITHLRRRW